MNTAASWQNNSAAQEQNNREPLSQLLSYLQPHWRPLLIASVLLVLNSVAKLAGPYLIGLAVDRHITQGELAGLHRTMLLLLSTYLLIWPTQALQLILTTRVSQAVLANLRAELFQHLQRLSLRFFEEHPAGDLISRLTSDTNAINNSLSNGLPQLLGHLLLLSGISAAMLWLNWQLALISMTVLPLMLLSTRYFSQRARRAARQSRAQLGEVSSQLEEKISGVRVVQAFGREEESYQQFRRVNASSRDANVKAATVTAAFRPTLDVFSTIGIALILGCGGQLVLQEKLTIGVLITFLGYVQQFFRPVRAIGTLYTQFQTALAAAERVLSLLSRPPAYVPSPNARPLPPIRGQIEFEQLTFGYRKAEPVLKEISFQIQPGQMTALVGPTGAGKTTLVNLLFRFYDPDSGRILLDGQDIRTLNINQLRQQMGIVLQDTFLFSTTVLENIRYGRPEATLEEVINAAQIARADKFIRRLPAGYQTELSERGSSLSQGERQLLAIARAILLDPRILILDEATSTVDTRTEQLIQAALTDLLHGRTSLVIAHRLSTIRNADQVLFLDSGQISEQGTHQTLMRAQNRYYSLYRSQFDT